MNMATNIAADKTSAQVDSTFRTQQKASIEQRYRSYEDRIAALNALRDIIIKREKDIIKALAADYQKPASEVLLTEIFPVRQEIQHAKRHLRKWMKEKRVGTALSVFGTTGKVRPEPKGVCLIIAPWNYPFNLSLGPLASALAAGNRVIIKPSEMTPHTSALIKDMIEAIYPADLVAVFEGDAAMSTQLLTLPFDHIFFTGSPKVGKIVMEAAAKSLASVTLELGGKSPTIVGPNANIKNTAKHITWGKFANNGQTCVAPDHVFVHKDVAAEFKAAMSTEIARVYGKTEASQQATSDYARIVNGDHFSRVKDLIKDAKSKGATILDGGETDDSDNFIAPTLITDVKDTMEITREELFGPILPIIEFDDVETVIDEINANPKPLSLYIFAKDHDFVDNIVKNTSSGSVGINITVVQFLHPNLPFGGVNNSGIGAAHGEYGFKAFSHEKAILKDHFSITHMLFPPYTKFTKKLINLVVKILG